VPDTPLWGDYLPRSLKPFAIDVRATRSLPQSGLVQSPFCDADTIREQTSLSAAGTFLTRKLNPSRLLDRDGE